MFLQSTQIKRLWYELPLIITLSADDIVQSTLHRGEDVYALAAYLDARYPGFLAEWEKQCLDIARSFLKEVIEADEKAAVLGDFQQYKGMTQQEVRDRICLAFAPVINAQSPDYLKSSMIACIEYGLGNTKEAVGRVEFALCEKADPQFPHRLFSEKVSDKQAVKDLLVKASLQTAALLTTLIKKRRAEEVGT